MRAKEAPPPLGIECFRTSGSSVFCSIPWRKNTNVEHREGGGLISVFLCSCASCGLVIFQPTFPSTTRAALLPGSQTFRVCVVYQHQRGNTTYATRDTYGRLGSRGFWMHDGLDLITGFGSCEDDHNRLSVNLAAFFDWV